jgi:hypothetical protein
MDAKGVPKTIVLVGEKSGNRLLVMGEEFRAHHESNPAK